MIWLAIVLELIALMAYPLTFKIIWEQRRLNIFWLPYVFGGYAKPKIINFSKTRQWSKRNLPVVFIHLVLKQIKILKLSFRAEIKVIDPFITAMIVGGLQVAAGNVLAIIAARCKGFESKPNYQIIMATDSKEDLHWQGECIIGIRLGNIIVAWIRARIIKGRKKAFRWRVKMKSNL